MEKAKNQHKILRKEIAHRGLRSELLTITDNTGKIIHRTVRPLMVKFKLKDLFQIIVGSLLFGVPISFSEEVWQIAEHLPIQNTIVIGALSIFCTSMFIYQYYYKHLERKHWGEFAKRSIATYCVSLLVTTLFLTLIQVVQWEESFIYGIKLAILITLPASMSAMVVDIVK